MNYLRDTLRLPAIRLRRAALFHVGFRWRGVQNTLSTIPPAPFRVKE